MLDVVGLLVHADTPTLFIQGQGQVKKIELRLSISGSMQWGILEGKSTRDNIGSFSGRHCLVGKYLYFGQTEGQPICWAMFIIWVSFKFDFSDFHFPHGDFQP
jgi:hypothetical protein